MCAPISRTRIHGSTRTNAARSWRSGARPCSRATSEPMVWSPRSRPQWVTDLNAFGRQLGSPAALVALDVDSLLDEARRATGFDDFGTDGWQEPLRIFVR